AYLARPTGLAVIGAAILVLAWRRRWKGLGLFLAPAIVLVGGWLLIVWIDKGSPLYSVQSHHLRVTDILEGMRAGWRLEIPSAAEFARTHSIPGLIAANTWQHLRHLFSLHFLGVLGIGLLGLWGMRKMPLLGLLLWTAILHFILAAITWSTTEGDRFLQPVYVCLLPLSLGGMGGLLARIRIPRPREVLLLLCLIAAGFCAYYLWATRAVLKERQALPALTQRHEQMLQAVAEDAVIATDEPFILNWLFDRPTIYLPSRLDPENIQRFIQEYDVSLIALLNVRPDDAQTLHAAAQAGFLRPLPGHYGFQLKWYVIEKTGPSIP
ncbi:hypothetical protein HQ520_11190, partial [bacterium]|nr:hypothetical protein [bacterium]